MKKRREEDHLKNRGNIHPSSRVIGLSVGAESEVHCSSHLHCIVPGNTLCGNSIANLFIISVPEVAN
jgi:hypothetical protein